MESKATFVIRNKHTLVEDYCGQDTIDKITELKLWKDFEVVKSPTQGQIKSSKPPIEPIEIIEFRKQHEPETEKKQSKKEK